MSHKWLFFIVLILLVIIVWKSYWKLQMMYNSSILSFYTPDTFPPTDQHNLDCMTHIGEQKARESKVIITSLLRDVESRIPEIKKKVERVGGMFMDYHVFI